MVVGNKDELFDNNQLIKQRLIERGARLKLPAIQRQPLKRCIEYLGYSHELSGQVRANYASRASEGAAAAKCYASSCYFVGTFKSYFIKPGIHAGCSAK